MEIERKKLPKETLEQQKRICEVQKLKFFTKRERRGDTLNPLGLKRHWES